MFSAVEVIARPQTQESTPSLGAIHSAGTPSSVIASVVPRPPSAITDLARLEQVRHRGVGLGEVAELVAVVEQVAA